MTLDKKLRLLIIDDDALLPEVAHGKGYDQISERYPGIFEIEVSPSFNSSTVPSEELAIFKVIKVKYDLILLDYNFSGQPDQGEDILMDIREAFERYIIGGKRNFSEEQRFRNKDTYIIGVSNMWKSDLEYIENMGWRLNGYTPSGKAEELFVEIDRFLREKTKEYTKTEVTRAKI
ncbi:MAG: hypothetical protein WCV90_03190 [Candidatus Woesearchaeota archaeon]|jgi:hypothetical protein